MGNRAVITIKEKDVPQEDWNSLYLHWNGGRDSVEPFLHVAKLYEIRCQEDSSYAIARLSQLIGNTLGGTLSLGVGAYKCLDTNNYDNGTYVVEDWEIVEREHLPYENFEEQSEHNFDEFVDEIRSMNDGVFGYTTECGGEIV
jgi:hypothetical protein|tara:strand:+ start:121 stop:549 length:429 start_codon:yes stop_codon:yes gene_type:complete